jgi:hypothetical protein
MFQTSPSRFLVALAIQVVAAWLAFEFARGNRLHSAEAVADSVTAGLLIAIVEAGALVVLSGVAGGGGLRAWLRAGAAGALIGGALVLVGLPQVISGETWVAFIAGPVALVLGLYVQIRWGLAPLIAFRDGAIGLAALRGSSLRMRGHGFAALLVVFLLGAFSLAVFVVAYLVGGAETLRDISRPLALVLAVTAGLTQTLWLTWLASLYQNGDSDGHDGGRLRLSNIQ